jgi:muconate cycloisomerase
MRLADVEVHATSIPLRRRAWHAGAARTHVEPVFVVVRTTSGVTGSGETIARSYLTGESPESVCSDIRRYAGELVSFEGQVEAWLAVLREMSGRADAERRTAAFCGLELALLDAIARDAGLSVGALLGIELAPRFEVALTVLERDMAGTLRADAARRAGGFRAVKVKVGGDDDVARVSLFRGTPTWIDANGVWSLEEAERALPPLVDAGARAVEQPLHAGQRAELGRLERQIGVPVSADESLCTRADAEALLRAGSCSVWNLRLAKNGGLFNALAIGAMANDNGIDVQIGALVGESSLLGAAGLWLASAFPRRRLFEGCYGTRLLAHDPCRPALVAGGTIVPRLEARGLGVTLDLRGLAERARRP